MLGLNASATPGEISAAYRQLAQQYHPDKVAGLAPEFQVLADKRMKEINATYELLKGRGNSPQTGGLGHPRFIQRSAAEEHRRHILTDNCRAV